MGVGDRHPKLMQISKEITLASCHPSGTLGMQKPKKQRCKRGVEVGGISIDGGQEKMPYGSWGRLVLFFYESISSFGQ